MQRRYPVEAPYDLRQTLHLGDYGRRHPCVRVSSDDAGVSELHRASHTPQGPVCVRVRVCPAAGTVEAEAWGPGDEWMLAQLPAQLALDDRPPTLSGRPGRLQRRNPGIRLGRAPDLFDLLVHCVIRQRVAWRDAVATQLELLQRYGQPAPGPLGLTLPISVEQWHGLGTTDLAAVGLERKRARTILELAARARHIAEWSTLAPASFAQTIEQLPGIGPWTSGTARALGLGDGDAVPLGDYELPSMIAWALAGEARADDARMLELLEPWAGMRYRVIQQLRGSGLQAPRFGPRIRGQRPR